MKSPLNRFFKIFATVVATVYVAGALASLHVADAAQQGMLMPSAPKAVEDAAYLDAEGATHALSAHKGKVVVVHFWAKWCPPCVEELPLMEQALQQLDAGEALVVLPLSLDKEMATVQAFYAAHDITTLPALLDDKGKAMRLLEIRGLPSTVILNRKGEEIARRAGVVDWSSPAVIGVLEEALAKETAAD